ncbi:MAG TPA: hypothetical protein VJP40_03215 [bacterium]|nr:hypothetical protein [bacterium]
MSASLKSNAANSDLAPPTEPPQPQSEGELLKLREANAKAALQSTAKDVAQNLLNLIDLRPLVREHPWKSSGIAALAGFFVGLKIIPSPGPGDSAAESGAKEPAGPSPWATLTSTLVETGGGAIKAALLPWLAQKIQDWMPKAEKQADASEGAKQEEAPFSP